jgi:monovalent cation:H+ antiporter-2, CPA2 family
MHHAMLISDLAVVMIVSGLTTLLFRWLKQPVVLGYLLAGLIVGPNTPPILLVRDQASIATLADLGLLFLMFSLGLDFSLRKLSKVGTTAGLAAVFEIAVIVWLGVVVGGLFGWPLADRILLGVGLAISSTAIIIKALRDSGEMNSEHSGLISGMLVVEDIFIILVMTFLPGFLHGGEGASTGTLAVELLKLPTVLIAMIVVGLIAVPALLQYVGRFKSNEMLLIIVLALLFGAALLMESLRYSIALGAFIVGALVAESRTLGRIKDLTEPLRDMFSAVFFVAMGMLIEPGKILPNIVPILVLTIVFMVGKIFACSLGLFAAGHDSRVSVRAGLNMAQLGEFAFIIATMGAGITGSQLFPVFISIAVLNAVVRPCLVSRSDAIAERIASLIPPRIRAALLWFNRTVHEMRRARRNNVGARFAWSLLMQIAINCALTAAIFLLAAFVARLIPESRWPHLHDLPGGPRPVLWLGALVAAMPLLIVSYRKLEALAMLLSEMAVPSTSPRAPVLRPILQRMLHGAGSLVLAGLIVVLSTALLPPLLALGLLVVVASALAWFFGHHFNAWYSRAKVALVDTWTKPPEPENAPALPPLLDAAELELFEVKPGPVAGKLIRELNLRARSGVSIVALDRAGKRTINPGPDDELQTGDKILLLGEPAQLKTALALLAQTEG